MLVVSFGSFGSSISSGAIEQSTAFVSDMWPMFVVVVAVIGFGFFMSFWRK